MRSSPPCAPPTVMRGPGLQELRDHVAGLELGGEQAAIVLQPLASRIAAIEGEDSATREQLAQIGSRLEQLAAEPGRRRSCHDRRCSWSRSARRSPRWPRPARIPQLDELRRELDGLGERVARTRRSG